MRIEGNVYYIDFRDKSHFRKRVLAAVGIASLLLPSLEMILADFYYDRKTAEYKTVVYSSNDNISVSYINNVK